MDGKDLSYGDVQRLSYRIARGLANSGVTPGEKVAILSGNDPIAFACVFGISRAGAVWCPINPRNEATENQFILDAFDCSLLLFHSGFAPMVDQLRLDHPDTCEFLDLIARYRVTHPFLPPTVIYMLLDHPKLESADLSSLQCFWYGAAPISVARLTEALEKIGPMAQLFGQTEAPMMISMMPPEDHYNPDGSIATGRLSSAGRVGPLVQVCIMDGDGNLMPARERGEIVVRGSLVMDGYYKNAEATAEASVHGWHHSPAIGYLDADNFLYIVGRAKDMIITGGFNAYSVEV